MAEKEKTNQETRAIKKLWIVIALLCFLSPLGLLASGTAWGEWSSEQLRTMLGYIPEGLERLGKIWNALLADYSIPSLHGTAGNILSYIISAVIGVGLVSFISFILGKIITSRHGKNDA